MELTTLFCDIDDFCSDFLPEYHRHLLDDGKIKRVRKSTLSQSEVMTIIIEFQRSGYRTFKYYYQRHVCMYLRWAFPKSCHTIVSWNWWARHLCLCVPILGHEKGRALGFRSLIQCPLRCVIIGVSTPIRSLMKPQNGVKTPLAGSMDSNYIWLSMTVGNYSPFN